MVNAGFIAANEIGMSGGGRDERARERDGPIARDVLRFDYDAIGIERETANR